ncbi:MAG: hypothetical protein JWP44_3171 [Mucilaginibacter sp.]|nr:hypothetical protein [Mucilaginibacter sp.]
MDQYSNNSENDFLGSLLANPANDGRLYANNLQRLTDDFPQSGILHALVAHASDDKNLKRASVYFNPASLYKLINAPASFKGVPKENIVIQASISSNSYHPVAEDTTEAFKEEPAFSENYFNQPAETETDATKFAQTPGLDESSKSYINDDEHHFTGVNKETSVEDPAKTIAADAHFSFFSEPQPDTENDYQEDSAIDSQVDEAYDAMSSRIKAALGGYSITRNVSVAQDEAAKDVAHEHQVVEPAAINSSDNQEKHPIEEDVYDEIASIENIDLDQADTDHHTEGVTRTEETLPNESDQNKEREPSGNEESSIRESADTSNFTFAENEPAIHNESLTTFATENIATSKNKSANTEQQDLSRYHDEKMPYSFMWWLDKTRREHAGICQPFVKPETTAPAGKGKHPADELQQQYYENIFHITSVEELDKSTAPYAPTAKFDGKSKEQLIIQRFIEEEPQIRPQSSDKLDNENKAKKSSEDRDELVTETLATIYTDQMLYHKAIASYKKLMLKFPEKSRYFAEKIEQLEKKTN